MRQITLKIPDVIYQSLDICAKTKSHTVEDMALDILSEYVYPRERPSEINRRPDVVPRGSFVVANHFSSAPYHSKEWAQRFVDVALSYLGVSAFLNEAGIGFNPNFVFIERIYLEEEESGFCASFGCPPEEFSPFGHNLENGWRQDWSRHRIRSIEQLEVAIKCIHITANLKRLERNESVG